MQLCIRLSSDLSQLTLVPKSMDQILILTIADNVDTFIYSFYHPPHLNSQSSIPYHTSIRNCVIFPYNACYIQKYPQSLMYSDQ